MNKFSGHPLSKEHNIDSVMSSLWNFYKQNFVTLFAIAVAMSLISQYIMTLVNLNELQTITDPQLFLKKIKEYSLPMLIVSVVHLLFMTIFQYYIMYRPINNKVNIVYAITQSLRYFVPYIIIMVLLAFTGSVAILLGLIALVIGAFFAMLYIMTIYLFILPVLLSEGPDIAKVIGRTLSLVHRNFWSNLGWVTLFIIILFVISIILSSVILVPFTADFINTIFKPDESVSIAEVTSKPLYIILSIIVNSLTMPLLPIFSTLLYFNAIAREKTNEQDQISNNDGIVTVDDLYSKTHHNSLPDSTDNHEDNSDQENSR